MTQQLNVKNLVVDLQTESGMARAVDALNLTLQKGHTFALVGESGCGKSMTALSLLRLLPDNAVIQSGQVKLSDVDVFQLVKIRCDLFEGAASPSFFKSHRPALIQS